MIRHNFVYQARNDNDDRWYQEVDMVTDVIDLVVNPHYCTYESMYVTHNLLDIGVDSFLCVSGNINSVARAQYVTMRLYDPEDVVKIKMLTLPIEYGCQHPYNLFRVERSHA